MRGSKAGGKYRRSRIGVTRGAGKPTGKGKGQRHHDTPAALLRRQRRHAADIFELRHVVGGGGAHIHLPVPVPTGDGRWLTKCALCRKRL